MNEAINKLKANEPIADKPIDNKQTILGRRGLVIYLILNNMFLPLSLDLYLPALPGMSKLLNSPPSITNLTFSLFIFAYAISIIFWGPISDKYGRRPCMLVGTSVYIVFSLLCGFAGNIYFLIVSRILQGLGMGAVISISIAIIKDCYSGRMRENVLALVYTLSSTAPVFAPLLGAQILRFTSWRATFLILAAIGTVSLIFAILYKETQPEGEAYLGPIFKALGKYGVLFKNKPFLFLTLMFTVCQLPFMAYVSISSYIFVEYFSLSEQSYSFYFALNAFLALFGPIIYIRFFRRFPKKTIGTWFFILGIISGILVIALGRLSPIHFLVVFTMFALLSTAIYTYAMSLILDQHKGDSGTATSMINASATTLGSIGTLIVSFFVGHYIIGLGLLIIIFSLLPLIGWFFFLRSGMPCIGINKREIYTGGE